eukprot:Colp12_sorted_trinity150504_noHs@14035
MDFVKDISIPWKVSQLVDSVQNVVMNYSETEVKVRDATNLETWGPSGTQMGELAKLTYSYQDFPEIMGMLWKRLQEKHWRHVYKSLLVIDYLIRSGSERVVEECRERVYEIRRLETFQYVDEGKDTGINVREKAKVIAALLNDDDKLREERKKVRKNKDKYTGISSESARYGGFGKNSFGGSNQRFSTYDDEEDSSRNRYRDEYDDEPSKKYNDFEDEKPKSRTQPAVNSLTESPKKTTTTVRPVSPLIDMGGSSPKPGSGAALPRRPSFDNGFGDFASAQAPAPAPVAQPAVDFFDPRGRQSAPAATAQSAFDDFADFQSAIPTASPKPAVSLGASTQPLFASPVAAQSNLLDGGLGDFGDFATPVKAPVQAQPNYMMSSQPLQPLSTAPLMPASSVAT